MKLSELFYVFSGSSLDLNKMTIVENNTNGNTVNFVSRTANNQGVVAKVKIIPNKEPFDAGLISVALGGSVLSSFVQQKKFYTAEHMKVLKPKKDMTIQEKLYYCICITKNNFRYTTHGREADRSIKNLELPSKTPDWVNAIKISDFDISQSFHNKCLHLFDKKWKPFEYEDIFEIKKGKRIVNSDMNIGTTPCIRPIEKNNGVYKYIDIKPNHQGNTITVNYNGSVGEAFYQPKSHFSLDDINVLYPKNFTLNPFIAMFLVTLIRLEKYRFNYGRKWHKERMEKSIIKLPVNNHNEPDWEFMEQYIKSLPYSKNLDNN